MNVFLLSVASFLTINSVPINSQSNGTNSTDITFYVPPSINGGSLIGDQYENNNSIDSSINLTPSDYFEFNGYETTLDANLLDSDVKDVDYFYFKMHNDFSLNLEINEYEYTGGVFFELSYYSPYMNENIMTCNTI